MRMLHSYLIDLCFICLSIYQETVDNRFKYVDITDKLDWGSIKSGESDMVDLEFSLDETLVTSTVKYVTICNVWEKSSTEVRLV